MAEPKLAVIWIDWYAYHVARFEAVANHAAFRGRAAGIELVGGEGVHAGLRFRDVGRSSVPIITLLPGANWSTAGQWRLAVLLWQRLTALGPSLVMVPGYYTLPALAAALWGRVHRARTILMSESTEADHVRRRWKEAIKGTVVRRLFQYAIVGGTRHREYLQRLGFDDSRIGLRYNVVDNAFFAEGVGALRALGRPKDDELPAQYFLFVGRLAPEKNLDQLLRSFWTYRQRGAPHSPGAARPARAPGGGAAARPLPRRRPLGRPRLARRARRARPPPAGGAGPARARRPQRGSCPRPRSP